MFLKNLYEQAYTQKGILLKQRGDDDEALECFEKAASFGNTMAKKQSIAMNPYARMCNQMLSEIFSKYQSHHIPNS